MALLEVLTSGDHQSEVIHGRGDGSLENDGTDQPAHPPVHPPVHSPPVHPAVHPAANQPVDQSREEPCEQPCDHESGPAKAARSDARWSRAKILAFGQLLSLFLTGTGAVQSSLYLDCHLSAPAFSLFLFYLPLCLACLSRLCWEEWRRSPLPNEAKAPGGPSRAADDASNERLSPEGQFYLDAKMDDPADRPIERHSLLGLVPLRSSPLKYAGAAFTDVCGNYCTVLAFKYTTIASVSLFDALAIPSAMLVSRFVVKRRYTRLHIAGVLLCCVGVIFNMLQDYEEDERLEQNNVGDNGDDDANDQNNYQTAQEQLVEQEYPHKMAGDTLAILGGILCGISDTWKEVAVREWGTKTEFLGCMAFFATLFSSIPLLWEAPQMARFFGRAGNDTCSETKGLFFLWIYVACSMWNYVGESAFLEVSEAALLNLSLLTGDLWAVMYSVVEEGIVPPSSFYVALLLTIAGVLVYEMAPSPVEIEEEKTMDNDQWKRKSTDAGGVTVEMTCQNVDLNEHIIT